MPFTLSHSLFAVPLKRVLPSLSVTGLILGSMAPDIEYFIAMQPFRSIGHSLEGFFLLAVPTCTAFAFAFHRIIKPAIPHMLPSFAGINRFAEQMIRPWRLTSMMDWLLFLLSVLLGFYSHVFLDSWTHGSGWFVQRIPFLTKTFAGDQIYHITQLSLSVIGLLVPALYLLYRWYKWQENKEKSTRNEWTTIHSFGRLQWLMLILLSGLLFLGKLIVSGTFFSISIWAVAPLSSCLLGLYATTLVYLAIQANNRTHAIVFLVGLYGFIGLYKLLTLNLSFSWPIWVAYIWILSAIILLGAYFFKQNEITQ